MDAIVGKDYTVGFDLIIGSDYVAPDSGSVAYTLLDNSGAVLGGLDNVPINDNQVVDNQVFINVLAANHTIAGGKTFEQRTVKLTIKVGNKPHTFIKHYYVTPWLNYRVDPVSVLALLGLKEGEVWLDQVDFVSAYYRLAQTTGFEAALSSGDIKQITANDAIRYAAAMDMAQCLELKALRKAGGDTINYNRFDSIDFAEIRASLEAKLDDLLGSFSDTELVPTLFMVTNGTNPITGV